MRKLSLRTKTLIPTLKVASHKPDKASNAGYSAGEHYGRTFKRTAYRHMPLPPLPVCAAILRFTAGIWESISHYHHPNRGERTALGALSKLELAEVLCTPSIDTLSITQQIIRRCYPGYNIDQTGIAVEATDSGMAIQCAHTFAGLTPLRFRMSQRTANPAQTGAP